MARFATKWAIGSVRAFQVARGLEEDPDAPPEPEARRSYLLDRLDHPKSEAIRRFEEGGLKGDGLPAGVVALVNDTRSSLAAGDQVPRFHRSHLDVELDGDRPAAGPP